MAAPGVAVVWRPAVREGGCRLALRLSQYGQSRVVGYGKQTWSSGGATCVNCDSPCSAYWGWSRGLAAWRLPSRRLTVDGRERASTAAEGALVSRAQTPFTIGSCAKGYRVFTCRDGKITSEFRPVPQP